MTSKTRKRFLPVALVMAVAAIGVVAVAIALAGAPRDVQAHGDSPGSCDTPTARAFHNAVSPNDPCPEPTEPPPMTPEPTPEPTPAVVHASYPQQFWLEGLDNGARLSWEKPKDIHAHASVVGYRIHRDAWHPTANHPINMYDSYDATIDIHPENILAASYSDRGLAYNTVYTYNVRALVRHSSASVNYHAAVAEWWNPLTCREMNDVVEGHVQDGPAIGPDNATSPYCGFIGKAPEMELSDAAKVVVRRAYGAKGYNLGMMSYMRTIETATSGGLLDALISPPSPPRNVMADEMCADPRGQTFNITVTWMAPSDPGKVPAEFPGCTTCTNRTPIHIGGDDAGIEIQPGMAVITGYKVERMTGNGPWMVLDDNVSGMSYTDGGRVADVQYKYRVTAMNNASRYSDPSAVVEITVENPPDAQVPTSPDADPIAATANETAHVLFTWDPPGTAAGTAEWRDEDDVDVDNGNISESMVYVIERLDVNDASARWVRLESDKPHQYLPNVSAEEAIDNVQTQEYTDTPPTGEYKYRVSAQLAACDRSEWVVTAREVQFTADLGNATGLSASAAPVPGIVNLSWTPAPNASVHWLAGIKQADWDAGDYSNIIWTQTQGPSAHFVTGLDSGDEYVFTVIGGSSVNGPWGSWTALMRVTPN